MELSRREVWAEARRLVVQERQSYAVVAEATGLPLSTLQKRAAKERWMDQQEVSFGYDQTVKSLKSLALKRAYAAFESAKDGDELLKASQVLYAWKTAEQAFPEHRYTQVAEDPKARLAIQLETLELFVEHLTEHDRSALAVLQPHIVRLGERLEAAHGA